MKMLYPPTEDFIPPKCPGFQVQNYSDRQHEKLCQPFTGWATKRIKSAFTFDALGNEAVYFMQIDKHEEF